jgi:hypothetical protein
VTAKPLDLPPAVAGSFVDAVKDYFAEEDRHKRDEIALRQLHVLREHQGPHEQALELSEVKAMFLYMGNQTKSPGSRRGY